MDFKNTVVIMTSNIGSQYIEAMPVGASETEQAMLYERMKEKVTEQLRQHFRPELLNRIDETIVFHALNKAQIKQIVDLLLAGTQRQLADRKMTLEVTDAAKDLIADAGFDPLYGARPLRRTIQRLVENPISSGILRREFREGDTIVVDRDGERMGAGQGGDVFPDALRRPGPPIRPVRTQRVPHVHHREHPGGQRDFASRQAARVPAALRFLVMAVRDVQRRAQKLDGRQHLIGIVGGGASVRPPRRSAGRA